MARGAVQAKHSGRFESDFTLDFGEVDGVKTVWSESTTGVFQPPGRAHMTVTSRLQGPPSVEIDGRTIETPSYVISYEALIIGEDVYMMNFSVDIDPSYGGDLRQERDDYNEQSFDPFLFFDYHRLLGFYNRGYEADFWLPEDLAAQISVVEQELNGERVYHITGPIAIHRAYPLIGSSALDGALPG